MKEFYVVATRQIAELNAIKLNLKPKHLPSTVSLASELNPIASTLIWDFYVYFDKVLHVINVVWVSGLIRYAK